MIPDPLCMEPAELAGWHQANAAVRIHLPWVTDDPCVDCTVAFARMMQAEGRCNGIPGMARGRRRNASPDPGWREQNRTDYFRRKLRDMGLDMAHAERVG